MEFLPLLIIPTATLILLLVLIISKVLTAQKRDVVYGQNEFKKEKKPESYYFILIMTMSLSLIMIGPWVGYYIVSGAKLTYVDNFITQIFIMSLIVLITTKFSKIRESK